MTITAVKTLDPVTVEIIRNALTSAADDMNATLIRSAYSPILYEGGDCVVALLDTEHRVLGQSAGLPLFLGNLETCSIAVEELYGREVWQEGDVWILNDSYLGGTHLNDVTIFAPIFDNGSVVGFAATRAHWMDMGSKDVGGSMDATDIFQEGFRMGPVKLMEAGIETSVVDLIRTNVRFPYQTIGDMHAMIAALRMGTTRMKELVSRYGMEQLDAARDEIFRQTEEIERETVRNIPDGVYEAEGVLDNDGINLDTPIPIRLKITVAGDTVDFDVTGSADQTMGPVNCGAAQAVSALRVGYKLLVSPDSNSNGGSFRPLTTQVRSGSVLGAVAPAPCQWYFSHLGLLIDLVSKAMAPAMPDRVASASHGDSMIITAAGFDPRFGRNFVSMEATLGGWGAWKGMDGESAMINNVNGSLKDLPVEMMETRYPLRINEYSIRPNSGGPGQWRGGNGVVREYEFLADCVVGLWFERSKTPAWGLFGGSDAQGPEVVINPGRQDEVRTLKANARKIKAGDVVRLAVGGGGGFGDVAQRSREDVEYDIVNGFITEDFAKTHYGY
ncbi:MULTISPECIES: hydantoinase B/oxoprolinase family protein [Paenarthrobacter]|uniref:Hydantoinase B/oxoprolinase family protein n=1 Tax=Paenarthrobacter ureafaciens TaxID=37931 RepID=A0AAX3EN37_PAEUR|nr:MULTISPECIES: hydantoinase B/oxoprolinase family protein [Paenarthrobacter]NKR13576.1 5-oxoprolinase [Arthrobacter sp. M5]NKR15437.1 5-oxoprolinase [Arthrobacter sp. M6]OEH59306.1 5-oxoprolinase [Arthrobacter sp. D2]OEH60711.1 5-oxoprolinase [Arthrobacter sp. D4]MDO5864362.1 hydantoinase B/oxoprolinase family protein [Paenarthrobacter sp. SD-2]